MTKTIIESLFHCVYELNKQVKGGFRFRPDGLLEYNRTLLGIFDDYWTCGFISFPFISYFDELKGNKVLDIKIDFENYENFIKNNPNLQISGIDIIRINAN